MLDRLAAILLLVSLGGGCDDGAAPVERDAARPSPGAPDASEQAPDASADAGRTGEPAGGGTWADLVDNEAWRRYDAAQDPLRSHQPPVVDCQLSATYVEYDSFEVDTTRCNYLLAETSSLRAVPLGTEVRLELLHYDLLAPEPAETHIAVLFGDVVQWEQTIAIPAPGNQVTASFRATAALGFQDPIRLHLHNHGANTYLLVALQSPE